MAFQALAWSLMEEVRAERLLLIVPRLIVVAGLDEAFEISEQREI